MGTSGTARPWHCLLVRAGQHVALDVGCPRGPRILLDHAPCFFLGLLGSPHVGQGLDNVPFEFGGIGAVWKSRKGLSRQLQRQGEVRCCQLMKPRHQRGLIQDRCSVLPGSVPILWWGKWGRGRKRGRGRFRRSRVGTWGHRGGCNCFVLSNWRRSRSPVPQGEGAKHNRHRNDAESSQNDDCRLGHGFLDQHADPTSAARQRQPRPHELPLHKLCDRDTERLISGRKVTVLSSILSTCPACRQMAMASSHADV